jgi:hypothetical protein
MMVLNRMAAVRGKVMGLASAPSALQTRGTCPEPRRAKRWLASSSMLEFVGLIVLSAVALGIYGRYAAKGGWYYDDWNIYALMRDQHGGFFADLHACAATIKGNRALACVYHAGEYSLFGAHRTDYLFTAIGFLVLDSALVYAIALRCRLPRPWALLLGVALVCFPASDSTRLWAVGSVGLYAMALVLGAILVALVALEQRGSLGLTLHLLSAALAVIAMVTYEITIPFVAFGGALYYFTYRDRRAVKRWAADVGLVVLFLVYRVAIVPVSSETGLIVHRNMSQTITRIDTLLNGAWSTWKFVYVPGVMGTVALVALAVATLTLILSGDRRFTMRAIPWLVTFAFGLALSAGSALVYLTANELYVPQVSGTFNRLNLPGSFGYAAMAVAILGLVYEVLRSYKLPGALAAGLVALMVAGSAVHQLGVSTDHIRSWEASWSDQQQALAGYRRALRGIPRTADIIGLDTPIWERGYIPVFASSWDLRGAIDYETSVDPRVSYPLFPSMSCGPAGMVEGAVTLASYDQSGEPLYFVSPIRGVAVRVSTESMCERVILTWGRPPLWGPTVTGVKFRT